MAGPFVADGVKSLRGLNIVARGANAAPKHSASVTLESHTEVIEVPQDRPLRVEESDAEDHVVPTDGDGVAVDCERLVNDANAHILSQASARDPIAIGLDDAGARACLELKADTAGHVAADEVVRGP